MREIYNVRCLGLKGDENHGRCWLLRPLCLIKYSAVYLLHFLLLKIFILRNCHTYLFLSEISLYNVLLCPLSGPIVLGCFKLFILEVVDLYLFVFRRSIRFTFLAFRFSLFYSRTCIWFLKYRFVYARKFPQTNGKAKFSEAKLLVRWYNSILRQSLFL